STPKLPPLGKGCLEAPLGASILFCRYLTGRDLVRDAPDLNTLNSLPLPSPQAMAQALRLTLAELEAATRALLSVFLAFLHARIAREETVFAQCWTQFR